MMKLTYVYYFTLVKLTFSTILKVNQCGIYDAEFSKIKYDHRLVGSLTDTLYLVSLRQCLTKCMLHTTCKSANYMRQNQTCEFLSSLSQEHACNPLSGIVYEQAEGWNHFLTDFKKKTVRYALKQCFCGEKFLALEKSARAIVLWGLKVKKWNHLNPFNALDFT